MRRIRLYNMILPIWMLWFFSNDLVVYPSREFFVGLSGEWKIYKSSILKIGTWGLPVIWRACC